MSPMAVSLRSVAKQYAGFPALADISLDFERGHVHALVGQNGAGKSTCLGIIAGRVAPTGGQVTVNGRAYPASIRPAQARARGVSAIYQELTVIPQLSALDNVMLATPGNRVGLVDRRETRRRYEQLCARLRVNIRADARASTLSIADQQMLEIMRALSVECSVLLMDEPTAALSPTERVALFDIVHQLRDAGVTVLFVSHYLEEVLEHADTVTVFRDGSVVETRAADGWNKNQLIRSMLGGELDALRRAADHTPAQGDMAARTRAETLRVQGLSTRHGVRNVDLVVRRGEIVGLGGLVGSGRTSLIHGLCGAAQVDAGRMWLEGREHRVPHSPNEALRHGVCLLPEDRKQSGLVPDMSGSDNVLLGQHRTCTRFGLLSGTTARRRLTELAGQYDIADRALRLPARRLSGGNQQKLLLARTGSRATRVLLADEPTRGVDIGAKSIILDTIRRLADAGTAVVFASSDLEEVAAISDRVYVLREGRVVAELDRTDGLDTDRILQHAFGHAGGSHD